MTKTTIDEPGDFQRRKAILLFQWRHDFLVGTSARAKRHGRIRVLVAEVRRLRAMGLPPVLFGGDR